MHAHTHSLTLTHSQFVLKTNFDIVHECSMSLFYVSPGLKWKRNRQESFFLSVEHTGYVLFGGFVN